MFVAVQSLSHVLLFVTPWTAAHQASLSFTISWGLLKFMSVELVMLFNHLILCHPFLLLPSILPASGSFLMSQLFASGGQSTGASACLGLTDFISFQFKGLSRVFPNATDLKHQFFGVQPSLWSNSHIHT